MNDASALKQEILSEIMAAMDERIAKKLAEKKSPGSMMAAGESADEENSTVLGEKPKPAAVEIEIESEPEMETAEASEDEAESGADAGDFSLPDRLKRLMKKKQQEA